VRRPASLALLSIAACSSSPAGTIQLVTGAETDTFTRSPAPTALIVDAVDSQGTPTTLARVPLPATNVDLGKHDENAVAAITVSAVDALGDSVVFGSSLPLQYGSLEGATIPIFVQRTGELARMPGPLSDSRQAPVLSQVQGRYLFLGAGNDAAIAKTTQLYDFLSFAPLPAPPTLPRVPQSIAFVGTVALLIDASGGTYFDFSTNASAAAPVPTGSFSFADVAGGATVIANDGSEYIVGATRATGAATAAILVVDPANTKNSQYVTGNLTWASLSAPRLGAAATWVTGRGLVVTGGDATATGVEILSPLPSSTGASLPYPPDSSVGAGTTALAGGQKVLVAGGVTPSGQDAGVRAIDLSCATDCTTVWPALPVAIGATQAFALNATTAIVVGSEVSGPTHVFRLTSSSVRELPTRVLHKNARASLTPLGTLTVVGGASEIESFTP